MKKGDPEEGWTTLHYATMYGCKDIVELLLEHGASPNLKAYYDADTGKQRHLASRTHRKASL